MTATELQPARCEAVYAVKMSWPTSGRRSEVSIIDEVKRVLKRKDRCRETDQSTIGTPSFARRLPEVFFHSDFLKFSDICKGKAEGEDGRTLRAIAFEVLKPIYRAPTVTDFWMAYLDIFQAERDVVRNKKRA